jgi:hypothetical protein
MKKENLVILKGTEKQVFQTATIQPNKHYRCIRLTESKRSEYLVYGIVFDENDFNRLFELSHTRVMRDFKTLGIVTENGKPISKSLFTNLADKHKYGTWKNALQIWLFRSSRELMYGFYPMQGTKLEVQKECYQWYLDIVNGNMESIDDEDVMFGNCGIPISYGKLRIS